MAAERCKAEMPINVPITCSKLFCCQRGVARIKDAKSFFVLFWKARTIAKKYAVDGIIELVT